MEERLFDLHATFVTKQVEDESAAKKELEKVRSILAFKVNIYIKFILFSIHFVLRNQK
jgi:hypothetical protein